MHFIFVYVYVLMWKYTHMYADVQEARKENQVCKPTNMGAGI